MTILDVIRAQRYDTAGSGMLTHSALLYALASVQGSRGCVVELGVGDLAWSTKALLEGVKDGCAITGHAPRLYSFDNRDVSDVLHDPFWSFRQEDSVEAAHRFGPFPSVSLLFIDTDHTYERTLAELRAWEPALTADAIVCGHDYKSPYPEYGVERAVQEYVKGTRRWVLQEFPQENGMFVLWPA